MKESKYKSGDTVVTPGGADKTIVEFYPHDKSYLIKYNSGETDRYSQRYIDEDHRKLTKLEKALK